MPVQRRPARSQKMSIILILISLIVLGILFISQAVMTQEENSNEKPKDLIEIEKKADK
ncbi:MAG: hypothetical protein JXA60_11350 [Candidatus Coatesbacteria bacterium]|nr:hypothetical protein [Candidatus Coatesbacteria bacterium]